MWIYRGGKDDKMQRKNTKKKNILNQNYQAKLT